jgi:hypothetical protein
LICLVNTTHPMIGVDNYFTTKEVILTSRKLKLQSTGRNRRGWPPKEIRDINDTRFNAIHTLPSPCGSYMIMRWVDNQVVLMVTTAHWGNEVVTRTRRHPRTNQMNKQRVQAAFGSEHGNHTGDRRLQSLDGWCRKGSSTNSLLKATNPLPTHLDAFVFLLSRCC